MTSEQREMCHSKCSSVWMVTASSLRLFQAMVVKRKTKFLYSAVFKESTLKYRELFRVEVVTSFFVLKSFGFLGFISLFDLIGVRNSLAGTAGISPVTVLKKKASRGRARASLTQTYHLDLRVCFHHVTLCLQSNLLSRTLFLQVCVCRCHTLFTLIYPYCSGMVMFPVH